MNDLIVITGQTATGKTKLALDYAKKLDGELISSDSRQVYKLLDIITGKDKEMLEKNDVPIRLIDVITPDKPFSSFDFVQYASRAIADIQKRKKTPIVVGGTYLYIKHLLYGQSINVPENQELREALEKFSLVELQNKLIFINEKAYESLNNSDRNNPRRLIRKIEILKGLKANSLIREFVNPLIVDSTNLKIIGLKHKDRESLVRAVTERVEKRLKQGAVEEVQKLLKKGYKKTDHGLQTIGYRQLIEHLEGRITLEDAKTEWINKEVQYAKRQYTFMKTNADINWETV